MITNFKIFRKIKNDIPVYNEEYDNFVKENGGIENIITNILNSITTTSFLPGKIRINNNEIYLCVDTNTSNRNRITSLYIDKKTKNIGIYFSYKSYSNNKEITGTLSNDEIDYITDIINIYYDRKKYNL